MKLPGDQRHLDLSHGGHGAGLGADSAPFKPTICCHEQAVAPPAQARVFVVAMVVGGSIAYVVASAANRPQLVPTAGDAPDFKLTPSTPAPSPRST